MKNFFELVASYWFPFLLLLIASQVLTFFVMLHMKMRRKICLTCFHKYRKYTNTKVVRVVFVHTKDNAGGPTGSRSVTIYIFSVCGEYPLNHATPHVNYKMEHSFMTAKDINKLPVIERDLNHPLNTALFAATGLKNPALGK